MRCQMCGAELEENDSFCYDCGFKLFSSKPEVHSSVSSEEDLSGNTLSAGNLNEDILKGNNPPEFLNASTLHMGSDDANKSKKEDSDKALEDYSYAYVPENMENKPIQSRFLEISSQYGMENDLNIMDATFNEGSANPETHSNASEFDKSLYGMDDDDPEYDDKPPKRSLLLPVLLVLVGALIVGSVAVVVLSGSGADIPFVKLVSNETQNSTPLNIISDENKLNKTNNTHNPTTCSLCGGTGTITCPYCHGACFLTCSECGGDGYINGDICPVCGGKGDVICSKCKCTGTITCTQCQGTGETSN